MPNMIRKSYTDLEQSKKLVGILPTCYKIIIEL